MLDKVKKLMIGENEYSFKMVNKTIFKIDMKYGNYGTVLQGIMEGKEFYTNALKLLSCCCTEREFEVDELFDLLTPQQLNFEISGVVTELYFDYIGVNDTKDNKETKKSKTKTEKN